MSCDARLPLLALKGDWRGADLAPDLVEEGELGESGLRIRCPRCDWQPRSADRWRCRCGTVWNTFDTRGVCPGCGHTWEQTQCLRCQEWSRHDDWYVHQEGDG